MSDRATTRPPMVEWTEARLQRLDEILPPPPPPAAHYIPVREVAGFLYVAGQTPHVSGELDIRGTVGDTVTAEQARELAGQAALNTLSALRHYLGELTWLHSIVSMTGFVAATTDFRQHPWVIDGASEMLTTALGAGGQHARAAVGVQSLPDGAPVEVSLVAYYGAG